MVRIGFALAAVAAAACQHHEEVAGPAGIPYSCADGRLARIVYDGGDPNRAPARLDFDGRRFELAPQPALNGLRYASDEGLAPGRSLIWHAEGDEAALIEIPADPTAGEREIVRCSRVREGEAMPEPHGSDHH